MKKNAKDDLKKNSKKYDNLKIDQPYVLIPYSSLPINFFNSQNIDPIFGDESQNYYSFKFAIRDENYKAGFIVTWDKNSSFSIAKDLWENIQEKLQENELGKDDGGILEYSYVNRLQIASLKIEITEQEPKKQLELFKKIIISLNEKLTQFLKEKNVLPTAFSGTQPQNTNNDKKLNK